MELNRAQYANNALAKMCRVYENSKLLSIYLYGAHFRAAYTQPLYRSYGVLRHQSILGLVHFFLSFFSRHRYVTTHGYMKYYMIQAHKRT